MSTHRLSLGARARWHALDPWLQAAARTDRFVNGALRAHVVEEVPLGAALEVIRGYLTGGAAYEGTWPADDTGRVAELRRLARERALPTVRDEGPTFGLPRG